MAETGALLQDEMLIFWIKSGIVIWSLLSVVAAMRNNGDMLKNFAMMLACQFYLIMAGLVIFAATGGILPRMVGMAIVVVAIISSIMRKNNFLYARYCIVIGALLAAFALLLI